MKFDEFFQEAAGNAPFPFQREFAESPHIPQLVHVPTGLGKTAMAVIGWLWRRFHAEEARKAVTPRRLVYCLPMRVLVEQTRDNAVLWLHNLGLLAGQAQFDDQGDRKKFRSYTPDFNVKGKVVVHVLMGGEDQDNWDIYPERDAIIIGTQDMLLSRALNRGYAASRSRWPMQFGMLHTDCLWVFDEIQLMGNGLPTTAQLEAFRKKLPLEDAEQARNGHGCRSVWMSATLDDRWLETIDFKDVLEKHPPKARLTFDFALELGDWRLDGTAKETLQARWDACKPLTKANATMGDAKALAAEIAAAHRGASEKAGSGTRTIAVVNTVQRARELFEALDGVVNGAPATQKSRRRAKERPARAETLVPSVVLLHSRFRPGDRQRQIEAALAPPPAGGMIIVSTQVIEAGVDVSAATLFTELAPWASLVQRFGRCNRLGTENQSAAVYWVSMPSSKADVDKVLAPYGDADLKAAAAQLEELKDVGLKALPKVELRLDHTHVIRRRDLLDLFDTTPDLAGNDIDIDRFVREVEDSDVRVFWRTWDQRRGDEPPSDDEPAPQRRELCAVPIGLVKRDGKGRPTYSEFRNFVHEYDGKVWRWNFLDEKWEKADARSIAPGQLFLVHADAGGYSSERGWDAHNESRVEPCPDKESRGGSPDGTEEERLSHIGVWQTIAEHTGEVWAELEHILNELSVNEFERDALRHAVRWHDRGKAHTAFIAKLEHKVLQSPDAQRCMKGPSRIAKAPDNCWVRGGGSSDDTRKHHRRYFRHELASAVAVLLLPDALIQAEHRDLVAYLVAAHHGKVRLSIRSLPNELRPDGNRRFARGVWDRDELPATDLGDGVEAPPAMLSLEPMELGLCEKEPFKGQPSWAERMIRLRDTQGPFRLAYLEAILRAADIRASRKADERAVSADGRGSGDVA
ncbi:MAG: CRISPR-associated endonuclease Cas3'' [Phycisphaerae bacterium]|nr:CRISPR-associated endonuclease Cas3'' [Phycisphaerae bacterium]